MPSWSYAFSVISFKNMGKIAADVQIMVNKLPEETRKKVEELVYRHLEACRKLGVEPENMDRVWTEAIEEVERDGGEFYKHSRKGEMYEARRRYGVYTSPKDTSLD